MSAQARGKLNVPYLTIESRSFVKKESAGHKKLPLVGLVHLTKSAPTVTLFRMVELIKKMMSKGSELTPAEKEMLAQKLWSEVEGDTPWTENYEAGGLQRYFEERAKVANEQR